MICFNLEPCLPRRKAGFIILLSKYSYKRITEFLSEPTYNGVKFVKGSLKPGGGYERSFSRELPGTFGTIDAGVQDDGEFFGLDLGAAASFVLGAEVKLKLGWYY